MAFKEKLKEKLKAKLSEKELEKLPKGFQFIGDIIVINLKPELRKYRKEIGEAILENFPKIRTVCNKRAGIKGVFREPQLDVIAGSKDTETTHIEHGCKYKFDVRKIMFAKGNVNERVRVAKQIKKNEIVVDMFAGIGYFTIPNAKIGKASKIYAIELNPLSFKYLKENLKLNHIERKVEEINGDSSKEIPKLVEKGIRADRVMMGLLPPPLKYISYALSIVKKGGIIHYDALIGVGKEEEDIEETLAKFGKNARLIKANKVKSYGPKIDHYVLDIKIF